MYSDENDPEGLLGKAAILLSQTVMRLLSALKEL